MKLKSGLSWIEVAVILAVAAGVAALFMAQKGNLEAMSRDDDRKMAINAMYYGLGEFYEEEGYYPEVISAEEITVVAEGLWTDPNGYALGDYRSDYHYLPLNCFNGQCTGYELRAKLEKEDMYIKTN